MISARTLEQLASMGHRMVEQDNAATACPVWVCDGGSRFPRTFLTAQEGEVYSDYKGVSVQIASAFDNPEIQILMRACFEAAGLDKTHPQIQNAYSACYRSDGGW